MSAKEMFEKLGYEKINDKFNIIHKAVYRTVWGVYEDYEDLLEVAREEKKIRFKYVEFSQLSRYRGVNFNLQEVDVEVVDGILITKSFGQSIPVPKCGIDITFEELQAINQQCKELGWIE